jgi:MFS transporter, ACS family, hexuronate transporter
MAVPGKDEMDSDTSGILAAKEPQATLRAWGICVLMLLATMLNYMDRQALAQQATEISRDLGLTNADYGWLEFSFGMAFAVGCLVWGLAVDRFSPRWIYPAVLFGWSVVGFATGWVTNYRELFFYRLLLGFFESGQWPCALVTVQRLLARSDRPLGNSILQSGASLGAIATPLVVLSLTTDAADSWRLPFRVIGAIGAVWIVAWLAIVRSSDLALAKSALPELAPEEKQQLADAATDAEVAYVLSQRRTFIRRFLALVVVVISINLCWQYFRAWMPKMLREQHAYTKDQVQYFSVAYYVATDVGCIAVGFLVKWLTTRGYSVHGARMAAFLGCALLTSMSTLAAFLPASALLLVILVAVGAGSLAQHPLYYAFSQELSTRRMGNVTGVLSCSTWIANAFLQGGIGVWIDRTGSFTQVTFLAGLTPLVGLLALLTLWNGGTKPEPYKRSSDLNDEYF